MLLADRITMLRKKSGWSQEELADKLNVSRQSVSKWESAQSVPDLDKILKLSELFDVTTDFLLKDEIPQEKDEVAEDSEVIPPQKNTEDIYRVSLEEANRFLKSNGTASKIKAFSVALCILSPIVLIILEAFAYDEKFALTEPIASGIGLIMMALFAGTAVVGFFFSALQSKRFDHLRKYPFETEYGVSEMLTEKIRDYRVVHMIMNLVGFRLCITSMIPFIVAKMLDLNAVVLSILFSYGLISIAVAVFFFLVTNSRWSCYHLLKDENGKKYRKI